MNANDFNEAFDDAVYNPLAFAAKNEGISRSEIEAMYAHKYRSNNFSVVQLFAAGLGCGSKDGFINLNTDGSIVLTNSSNVQKTIDIHLFDTYDASFNQVQSSIVALENNKATHADIQVRSIKVFFGNDELTIPFLSYDAWIS